MKRKKKVTIKILSLFESVMFVEEGELSTYERGLSKTPYQDNHCSVNLHLVL